jgi:DNA invertase Pin-like site-specific DNA recombinase
MVQQGKVARGSYLIIESLDRLTREHVQAGLRLCLDLLENGIRIVQLSPVEAVYDERIDALSLLMMIMELNRAHSESKRLSDLMCPAWRRKRQRARENGTVLTHMLPGWVEEHGGKLRLIPERAKTVKRIFALAAAGYGNIRIAQELNAQKVRPFGRRSAYIDEIGRRRHHAIGGRWGTGRWSRSYVGLILRDRRALGELQPRTRHQTVEPPIVGYYPAVVTEAEWRAVRAFAKRRSVKYRARKAHADLFTHLLFEARNGGPYSAATVSVNGRQVRRLINVQAHQRGTHKDSFPVRIFETAILAVLRQIDVREIVPANAAKAMREFMACARKLAAVRDQLADLEAALRKGTPVSGTRLCALETREKELVRHFAETQERAANSPAEAWREMRRLAASLDAAEVQIDVRLRLQSVLRRIIDRAYVLVMPLGRNRCAAVEIHFRGSPQPLMVHILRHQDWAGRWETRAPGRWWAYSVRDQTSNKRLELRNPKDAARMEHGLAARIWQNIQADVTRCKEIDAFHAFAGKDVTPTASTVDTAECRVHDQRAVLNALWKRRAIDPLDLRTKRWHLKKAAAVCAALRARIAGLKKVGRRIGSTTIQQDGSDIHGSIATGEVSEEIFLVE